MQEIPASYPSAIDTTLQKEIAKQKQTSSLLSLAGILCVFLFLVGLSWPVFTTRSFSEPIIAWHHAAIIVLHEGGHMVLFFLAYLPVIGSSSVTSFLITAGGTLAQLVAPLAVIATQYWKKNVLGSIVGFYWLGLQLVDISFYMDDARCRCMGVYLSPTEGIQYGVKEQDWTYMFGHLGVLNYDHEIAFATFWLGRIVMASACLLVLLYAVKHTKHHFAKPPTPEHQAAI
jgi:hypothetical protein